MKELLFLIFGWLSGVATPIIFSMTYSANISETNYNRAVEGAEEVQVNAAERGRSIVELGRLHDEGALAPRQFLRGRAHGCRGWSDALSYSADYR